MTLHSSFGIICLKRRRFMQLQYKLRNSFPGSNITCVTTHIKGIQKKIYTQHFLIDNNMIIYFLEFLLLYDFSDHLTKPGLLSAIKPSKCNNVFAIVFFV